MNLGMGSRTKKDTKQLKKREGYNDFYHSRTEVQIANKSALAAGGRCLTELQ